MARSHVDGNYTEREPNIGRMKDQLIILENIVEQMTDIICHHGENVEHMETNIGKIKHGFNESI